MPTSPLSTLPTGPAAPDPWHGANPLDPAFRDDPHPALRRLREEAPVAPTPFGFWRLARYADCVRLLREIPCGVRTTDGRLPGVDESGLRSQGLFMLQQDPPDHTRLRRLVSRAFTPRAVARLSARAEEIVEDCLRAVRREAEGGDGSGEFDLVSALALPLPSTLICEMLGVPASDREQFTGWTARATHGLAAGLAPPEVIEDARRAGEALAAYFEARIAERRARPTDDLLTELVRAEEEGDRLSPEELLSQAIGLLIAGFETTIGLIANGVRALLLQPAELARLRRDPELLPSAVEECLRYEGPILLTIRILHADARFETRDGPVAIPRDARVMALLAAANRDPEVYPEPDRFDVGRFAAGAPAHLAFGGGAHLCLGAHLARMEARHAFAGLLRHFDHLELAEDAVTWGPSLFRVPGRLPVRFRAA